MYKKDQKDDLGNCRAVSLTLVPEKVLEQVVMSAILLHVPDNQGIRPSQPEFSKGRSCSTEGHEGSTEGSGQAD